MSLPIPAGIHVTTDPGGRPALRLVHGEDDVLVALLGAQVLHWHHRGRDVLWTASRPEYQPGKPVRGGVPVVFPWFGDNAPAAGLPAHGFARSMDWRLAHAAATPAPAVLLEVNDTPASRAMWPHRFRLQFGIQLGRGLRLSLRVDNVGDQPFRCEQALHTYFAVGDVHRARVLGLEGVRCQEHAREPEGAWDTNAPLQFRAETDRVFQAAPDVITLEAPALGRRTVLTTAGARSAIVWNPWPAKCARLSQMAPDDWQRFVCIESANAREHTVEVAPGGSHTLLLDLAADA